MKIKKTKRPRRTVNKFPKSENALNTLTWIEDSLKDKEKEESHIRYIKNPKTPLSRLRNPKSRPRLEFDNKRQFKKLNQQNA